MTPQKSYALDVHLEEGGAPEAMAAEIRAGLRAKPMRLPSKYFYDERGSRLFERITELPEYYLTRAEQALLESTAREIGRLTRPEQLVELGSGSAKKTRLLIDEMHEAGNLASYMAVEVSQAIAERTASSLASVYPQLDVHAVVADFEHDLDKIPPRPHRLVALLGSTIGNFPRPDAVRLLRKVAPLLRPAGHLLLGTDLVKDPAVLEAAYNDSEGVTAEFNRNILNVINHQLDGNFAPSRFAHVSFYNAREERIESYLRAIGPQRVRLADLDLEVSIENDALIHTEVSCKYTRESVREMLEQAGYRLEHWFTDPQQSYALSLSSLAG